MLKLLAFALGLSKLQNGHFSPKKATSDFRGKTSSCVFNAFKGIMKPSEAQLFMWAAATSTGEIVATATPVPLPSWGGLLDTPPPASWPLGGRPGHPLCTSLQQSLIHSLYSHF